MKASRPKKTSFDHRAFRWMAAGLVGLFLVRSWKTADPEVLPRFVVVAAVLGVVLLLAVVRTLRGKLVLDRSILRNAVALAWLAGVVVSAASILVAVNRSEALFASLRAGVFFVLFVVLVRLMLGNEGRVRAAAAALGPLALVLGLVGAYQLVRAVDTVGWIWRTTYLVKGLAGHRNFLVQTLLVTLPFAAWSMVVHRGVKRLLMTGTVLLSGGLIAVLMVRSVWVAAIVATAASALLGAAAARKRGASSARGIRRHVAIAVGLLVTGAVIALVLLGPSGRTALAQRLRTLAQPASGSAGGRLFLWRTTLHMVRDHPLLGVGGGNWRIVFPAYAGNRHMMRDIWKTPRRPHNDYLWILAENGPAGLLAYLAMIATLLWWTARTTLAARDVPSMLLGVALFFAETAYTVFSAFSFPRERVGLSVVVTLVFAMATALHLGERPQAGKLGRRPLLALTAVALAITVAAGWIGAVRMRSEIHVRTAYGDLVAKRYRRAVAELDRAMSPFSTVDRSGFPVRLYRGIALRALGREEAARRDLEQACRESPYNVLALSQLATSYARLGDRGEAVRLWQKALKIHPGYRPAVRGLTGAPEGRYGPWRGAPARQGAGRGPGPG